MTPFKSPAIEATATGLFNFAGMLLIGHYWFADPKALGKAVVFGALMAAWTYAWRWYWTRS